MYIYTDEKNNAYIIVKVIGGTLNNIDNISSIATDNTCNSLIELKRFFIKIKNEIVKHISHTIAELNLVEEKNLNDHDQLLQIEILSHLTNYETIINILLNNIASDQINNPTYSSPEIRALLSSGIHAIVIDSQTNRDRYLKSPSPIHSVPHEVSYTDGFDEVKESVLGQTLRTELIDFDFTAKSKQTLFREKMFSYDPLESSLNNEDLLGYIYEIWEQANLPTEQWDMVSEEFERRIEDIKSLPDTEDEIDKEQILSSLSPIFWQTLEQPNIYEEIYDLAEQDNTVFCDKISVYVQFILGITCVYLKDNYKIEINIGNILESQSELCDELAKLVKEMITNNSDLETGIIGFVQKNIINNLTETDIENIAKKAKLEYTSIKHSDHFDEFFLCPTDKKSNWFSYGGSICLELSEFIRIITTEIPQILEDIRNEKLTSFLQETNDRFKLITRKDGNYLDYQDIYQTYKLDSLNIDYNKHLNDNYILHFALQYLTHDTESILKLIAATSKAQIKNDPRLALYSGNSEKVYKALLEHNIEINIFAEPDLTPLLVAILNFDLNHIKLLLEYGADPNISSLTFGAPLEITARLPKKERNILLNMLLDHDANINLRFHDGESFLHKVVMSRDHGLITFLCDKGVDLNATCNLGETAIFKLVSLLDNYHSIITLLLTKGANPNIMTLDGDLALSKAIKQGHISVAELLIEYGAKIYSKKDANFLSAIESGKNNPNYNLLFTKFIDLNTTSRELISAASYNNFEVIHALLQRNVPLTALNEEGMNVLQILIENHITASNLSQLGLCEELIVTIKAVALVTKNINNIKFGSLSLLQYLVKTMQHEISDILLDHISDVDHIGLDNETALYKAVANRDSKTVEILLKNRAKIQIPAAKDPLVYVGTVIKHTKGKEKDKLAFIQDILITKLRDIAERNWFSYTNNHSMWKLIAITSLLAICCFVYPVKITHIISSLIFILTLVAFEKEIALNKKIIIKREHNSTVVKPRNNCMSFTRKNIIETKLPQKSI